MLIDEAWAQLAQEHGVLTDASPDRSVDLVLRVPSWPPVPYDVKVFTSPLTPSGLSKLWDRHRHRYSTTQLLVVVPAASERLLSAAVERGVSVIVAPSDVGDQVRGVLIGADSRIEYLGPLPREQPERRSPGRVPWGTFTVAFDLLEAGPGAGDSQREIATRIGLTQARISQVLRSLNDVVALSDNGPEFDPVELGQWLAQRYPVRPRVTSAWLTLDPAVPAAVAAHKHLDHLGVEHAVSGQVAADWLAPWARPQHVSMWSQSLADLTEIGATPVGPREANLTLAVAEDPYLLASARQAGDVDRPATVAPWRVWVDLVHEGSADAAAALQRALLMGSIR